MLLRYAAAFQYPLYVAVEVEGPLIEIAGGNGDEAGGAASRHGDGGGAWMRTPNYLIEGNQWWCRIIRGKLYVTLLKSYISYFGKFRRHMNSYVSGLTTYSHF